MRSRVTLASCFVLALVAASGAARGEELSQKVDPWVLDTASRGDTEFLVMLREQGDLRGARALSSKAERAPSSWTRSGPRPNGARDPCSTFSLSAGAAHRSFWVANMVWVRGDLGLVEELAARGDVFHIYANPRSASTGPCVAAGAGRPPRPTRSSGASRRSTRLRSGPLGFTGQGVVIGGQDTGYDWTHPALKTSTAAGTAPPPTTTTTGTTRSTPGAASAAPTPPSPATTTATARTRWARWSATTGSQPDRRGARSALDRLPQHGPGRRHPGDLLRVLPVVPRADRPRRTRTPTRPRRPHVINNSWGCPPSEGCTTRRSCSRSSRTRAPRASWSSSRPATRGAAAGPSRSPGDLRRLVLRGRDRHRATTSPASRSRGPVTVDGSNRLKPDISAPGVDVRSSVPGGGYEFFSGTSMAGPARRGVVALLLPAVPRSSGDPDAIETVLTASAAPRTTTESCGGVPGDQVPNNTFGWGRVDALAAFNADLAINRRTPRIRRSPARSVTYTLTVPTSGPARPAAWRRRRV